MTPRSRASQKIVCSCLQVTEEELLQAIGTHQVSTLQDVARYTEAGNGCTYCHPLIRSYLKRHRHLSFSSDPNCSAK